MPKLSTDKTRLKSQFEKDPILQQGFKLRKTANGIFVPTILASALVLLGFNYFPLDIALLLWNFFGYSYVVRYHNWFRANRAYLARLGYDRL